jgi:hypothetical protein
MKMINLTPHKIVMIKVGGKEVEVEPSGIIARVTTIESVVDEVNGIPVVSRKFGEVEGLPEPKEDTIYIVSSLVLGAIKNRKDVFAPDTGATAIRDEGGRIIAVTRLIQAG